MPTRKDFRSTAAFLATIEDRESRARLAQIMADEFFRLNPRFDRRIFFKACGLTPTEVGMFSELWTVA